MQAPNGKYFKTLGCAHRRAAVSSRIRELCENLRSMLEVDALHLERLEPIFVDVHRSDF
jgi:hypothetical protein